jgi:hypothetical protein
VERHGTTPRYSSQPARLHRQHNSSTAAATRNVTWSDDSDDSPRHRVMALSLGEQSCISTGAKNLRTTTMVTTSTTCTSFRGAVETYFARSLHAVRRRHHTHTHMTHTHTHPYARDTTTHTNTHMHARDMHTFTRTLESDILTAMRFQRERPTPSLEVQRRQHLSGQWRTRTWRK